MFDAVISVSSHLSGSRGLGGDRIDPSRSVARTLPGHTRPQAVVPPWPPGLHGDRDGNCVLPGLPAHILGRVLETRVLGAAQGEAAVVTAVPTEGVVAAPELSSYLFIGRPTSGYQHYVETRQATDWKEDQRDDAHNHHGHDRDNLRVEE